MSLHKQIWFMQIFHILKKSVSKVEGVRKNVLLVVKDFYVCLDLKYTQSNMFLIILRQKRAS